MQNDRETYVCEKCQRTASRKIGSTRTLCAYCQPKKIYKKKEREDYICEKCHRTASRNVGSTRTLCGYCKPKVSHAECSREYRKKNIEKVRQYQKEYRHLGKTQKFCEICGLEFWTDKDINLCGHCRRIKKEKNICKKREEYICEKCHRTATRKIGSTRTLCWYCKPKLSRAEYRKANIEKFRQYDREYYKKNKDKKLAQKKEYRRRKKNLAKENESVIIDS